MTLEQNIRAILECNFCIAKEEIIEVATKRIMEQISRQNPLQAELEEIRQIRPCMRNPEQEGHEEYNKGWNDAIKEFLCNIDNFKEIDNE